LHNKKLDLILVNKVGGEGTAFGSETNQVTFISRDNQVREWPRLPKSMVAQELLNALLPLIKTDNVPVPPRVRFQSL